MDKDRISGRRIHALLLLCLLLMCILSPLHARAEESGETIYRYLTDNLGLKPAAACGIMGNMWEESHFIPNITGLGAAYGLCQWTGVRHSRLNSFCSGKGLSSSSVEGQLEFLMYELKNWFSDVYNYLQKVENTADGAYKAGYYFCMHFEKPANASYMANIRGSRAKNTYWPKFGAGALYLTGGLEKDGIALRWTGSTNGSFGIMRSLEKTRGYKQIGKAGKKISSYTDKTKREKTTYYYYIAVLNKEGKEQNRSNIISVTDYALMTDTDCKVSLENMIVAYTGKEIRPKVTVTYAGKTLEEGKDYEVTYAQNINPGKATATVTGIGSCKGSVTRTFRITKANVTILTRNLSAVYKKGKKLEPKVALRGGADLAWTIKSSRPDVVKVVGNDLVIKGTGKATVTVRVQGTETINSAKKTFTVMITPDQPVLRSARAVRGGIRLKWKASGKAEGYEIYCVSASHSLKEAAPFAKLAKPRKKETVINTGTGTFRVRMRAYRRVKGGKVLYSKWSTAKTVTVTR